MILATSQVWDANQTPSQGVSGYHGRMNTQDACSRPCGPGLLRRIALIVALSGSGGAAFAQGPVERVNAFYSDIRNEQRSDLVLLPTLAEMERPPIGADDLQLAMLLPAGSLNWEEAEAWATGAPQAAVLAALDAITKGEDYRTAMAFGQPYGPGVPRPMIASGLYTELGDPPSLSAASFGYMGRLDQAACLANVEATRLAAAGNPSAAIDVMTDWVFFARQMADREFSREAAWGYDQMVAGFERIRDIAYSDMRGAKALTLDQITAAIARLDERKIIGIDRLTLPRADQVAAEQLVARCFDRTGTLNAGAFSSAMAAVGSSDRPLRLFSEAARWGGAAAGHANRADTDAMLGTVWADFDSRWKLDAFDARNNSDPAFIQVDGNPRYAVIDAAMDDLTDLMAMRQQLRAEAAGTRTALGVVGYFYQTRNLPPTLSAIRPRWTQELEADPYNPDRGRVRTPPFEYFVPIRDTQAQGGVPHEMNVVARDSNFALNLRQDQFVLYSVGPDRSKDWARFVSDDPRAVQGDYLIWPPVISLLRIDLQQRGLLD